MSQPQAVSYRVTVLACYVGNIVQAMVINLVPLIFLPLREQFGLSFEQLGLLVLINFMTQVATDILFSHAVDRHGFRPFVLMGHGLVILGFTVFALSPKLFASPYAGFIAGTVLFSAGGGLMELLLSPIVNAIPTPAKASAMSVLHSFYSWGQVAVALVTTLAIFLVGRTGWPFILLGWMALPLLDLILFARAPMAPPVPQAQRQGFRRIFGRPFFVVALLAIACGGAAELAISQWTSAFMEAGLSLPKVVGDLGGMCLFAAMMGVGRLLHGLHGAKADLNRLMAAGAAVAALCYLIVALSPSALVSMAACALCGLAVSLLWPGTLALTAERFPLAGAWLFAILAAAGDIGASVGPWFISLVADRAPHVPALSALAGRLAWTTEQLGLRAGILSGIIFPLGAFFALLWMARARRREEAP